MSEQDSSPSRQPEISENGVPPHAPWVLSALVIVALVSNVNIAAANVALPGIGDAFGASQVALNLVGLGAGLGLAMSVVYFGALADRYGRKQILIIGLLLIVLASLLSAFAPSIELLILARIFTGVSAGMAFPTTLSLITALWAQGPRRTSAIAIWSSVGGMAGVAGSILAGLLLAMFWWGSVFLLSVPLAVLALVFVLKYVPSHVGESTEPVDHISGVLSVLAIASLVLGVGIVFTPEGTTIGIWLIVAAVVVVGIFGWRQARVKNPLFDLKIAKRRTFWAPALAGAIVFGGLVGAMFVGQQFMQNILGYSALGAGLSVVPAAVGLLSMAPVSARLVTKSGTRTTLLTGYGIVLVGFITMLFWREQTPYLLIGFGFLVIGAGASFVITAASRSLTNSTPVQRVGMASATSDLQSDLGGSVMQALLGALLAAGFSQRFADLIGGSAEAGHVSANVEHALQSSFASALKVADQYPQFRADILEAAKQSLLAGSLGAYLVGGIAIVIGIAVVFFALPKQQQEQELLEKFATEDSRPD